MHPPRTEQGCLPRSRRRNDQRAGDPGPFHAAGETASVVFDNPDSVEHNISVYPDQEAGLGKTDAIFTGEIIQAEQSITYDVPAVEAGEYYFQCDVHPNMNGAYVAE